MVYTLLGAPTLGFDLVRIEGGCRVAQILLAALNLTEADLPRLAAGHPGAARRPRWRETVAAADTSASVPQGDPRGSQPADPTNATIDLSDASRAAAAEQARVRIMLRHLERSRLGNLDALDQMIRSDILDWTWSRAASARRADGQVATQSFIASLAADVLADAVAAAYAVDVLPGGLRHQLEQPLQGSNARLSVGPPRDLPQPTIDVIEQLRTLTTVQRERLRAAVDHRKRSPHWAPAMHDASWAIHLSGRVRAAAGAQLLAVLAFRDAGFTARDAACGVWNAIAGVVADRIVQDMLPDDASAVLRAPWSFLEIDAD